MKKSGLILLSVMMAALTSQVFGQTPYYNQFHQQPLLNNPALSGMKSDVVVGIGYRAQNYGSGNGAVNTPTFSAIIPIMQTVKRNVKRLGAAGIMVLSDRTGSNGVVRTTGVLGSFAYNLPVTNMGGKFAVAMQLGYMSRSLDVNALRTGSQFNPITGNFDPGLANGETTDLGNTKGFGMVNLGAVYYDEDEYGDVEYYIGVSGQGVNVPNVSLFDSKTERLPFNFSALGGIRLFNDEQFIVTPNFRYFYAGPARSQLNIGSLIHYKIDGGYDAIGRGTAGIGLWYSQNNSVIASFEVNQPGFSVGLSYDFLINGLNSSPSQARVTEFVISGKKYIGKRRPKDLRNRLRKS
jgi:type IX secretion system PorP/SprF family membrane protein